MPTSNSAETRRRYFTAEKANKALPLVRAIVADIVQQWRVVSDLEQRIGPLLAGGRLPGPHELYAEELDHRRLELLAEQDKLREYLLELEGLGVELKSIQDGLCDFPSLREGREVCLCWKLGEASVEFWHEVQAGFAGRQAIAPEPPEGPTPRSNRLG